MIYDLAEDVMKDLQKTHPDIKNLRSLVYNIFNTIVENTLLNGSCHIRGFGKFIVYKSSRSNKYETLNFKFRKSSTFHKKLQNDKYLMERIPVRAKNAFTKEHEKKCNRQQKLNNDKAERKASKFSQQSVSEKDTNNYDPISNILDN